MICGNACVCIRRCDLWKRRVVNKHDPQSCCGQKRVCTYVVVSSKTDLRIHKAKVWGGVGWGGVGGADNVQVSSKTDLRIHKTKRWGGGVVLISLRPVNWKV